MTLEPLGTISVVSHGHGAMLGALLRDLEAQLGIDRWKVVITLNIVEDFDAGAYSRLRLDVIENVVPRGFGANHNAASRRAEGPLLLIVNPDIRIYATDALERIAGTIETASRCALHAPLVVNGSGQPEDSVRRNLTPLAILSRAIGLPQSRRDGPTPAGDEGRFFWVAGMFLILDLRAFQEIGGFDERYFLYCEDYDLCARLVSAGRCISLLPDVVVTHEAQRDSHRSWKHLRWHMASLIKVWMSPAYWKIVRLDRRASRPIGRATRFGGRQA